MVGILQHELILSIALNVLIYYKLIVRDT